MQYHAVPCSAVAGIGNPERFFSMLEALELPLQQRRAFADHHSFDTSPFQSLNTELILITTKDAVKCRRWADPRVWVIKVEPVFSDPEWLQVCHDMLKRIAERKNQSLQVRSQAGYSKPVSRFAPRR
jgi:tetraacyldisaccharide 4'-kinase